MGPSEPLTVIARNHLIAFWPHQLRSCMGHGLVLCSTWRGPLLCGLKSPLDYHPPLTLAVSLRISVDNDGDAKGTGSAVRRSLQRCSSSRRFGAQHVEEGWGRAAHLLRCAVFPDDHVGQRGVLPGLRCRLLHPRQKVESVATMHLLRGLCILGRSIRSMSAAWPCSDMIHGFDRADRYPDERCRTATEQSRRVARPEGGNVKREIT